MNAFHLTRDSEICSHQFHYHFFNHITCNTRPIVKPQYIKIWTKNSLRLSPGILCKLLQRLHSESVGHRKLLSIVQNGATLVVLYRVKVIKINQGQTRRHILHQMVLNSRCPSFDCFVHNAREQFSRCIRSRLHNCDLQGFQVTLGPLRSITG